VRAGTASIGHAHRRRTNKTARRWRTQWRTTGKVPANRLFRAVSKTVRGGFVPRGFESLPLRSHLNRQQRCGIKQERGGPQARLSHRLKPLRTARDCRATVAHRRRDPSTRAKNACAAWPAAAHVGRRERRRPNSRAASGDSTLAQPVVMTPGSLSVRGIIWVTRLERINSVEPDPAGSSVYERRPNGDVVDRGRAHHRET
jgi:hypothetical protein